MATEVLIDSSNLPFRTWKISWLKIHYRILLRFVLANLSPRLRTSECTPWHGHILYHIMTGSRLSLPQWVFENIASVHQPNPPQSLPHGCLITRLCALAGVPTHGSDALEAPPRPLSSSSEGRSRGQGGSGGETEAGGSSAGGSSRSKRRRAPAISTSGPTEPAAQGGFDMGPFMTSLQQYFTPQFDALGARFTGVEARMGGVEARMGGMEGRMTHLESEFHDFRSDFQAFAAGGGGPSGVGGDDDSEASFDED